MEMLTLIKKTNSHKEKQQEDETISDVIERILNISLEKVPKKDIRKAFGLWKDMPADLLEIMKSAHREMREEVNRRFSIQ